MKILIEVTFEVFLRLGRAALMKEFPLQCFRMTPFFLYHKSLNLTEITPHLDFIFNDSLFEYTVATE